MPVNNKIKIRRGNNIDLPAGGTESGELRYSIDTKELYIDDGSLNIKIGGDPYAFPISTATQTALDGKQLIGTYATGNGTANGTNTGDETLTTIKTKLGAATSVSDGYLKYQDYVKFDGKEPAITKNSGFNLPIGTTSGTVLEGRTFGTAANSAVGDFTQNQYVSPQTGDILLSGRCQFQTYIQSPKLSIGDGTDVDSNGSVWYGLTNRTISGVDLNGYSGINFNVSGGNAITIAASKDATLNGDVYLNKNLYVNSPTSSTYQSYLRSNQSENNAFELGISGHKLITSGNYYLGSILNLWSNDAIRMTFDASGTGNILSTTQSTLPTNGALVINGGVGADHVRANNFYGSGSNLTGVQSPITLTTNGTSGAATFSGNVLNVPNYDVSGGVNQTQTTVNGSTSGNMVCSMPFMTGSYKKVIIYLTNLVGTAEYIFPVKFVGGASKRIITTNVTVGTSGSYPDDRVNITATSGNGTITIEGY